MRWTACQPLLRWMVANQLLVGAKRLRANRPVTNTTCTNEMVKVKIVLVEDNPRYKPLEIVSLVTAVDNLGGQPKLQWNLAKTTREFCTMWSFVTKGLFNTFQGIIKLNIYLARRRGDSERDDLLGRFLCGIQQKIILLTPPGTMANPRKQRSLTIYEREQGWWDRNESLFIFALHTTANERM